MSRKERPKTTRDREIITAPKGVTLPDGTKVKPGQKIVVYPKPSTKESADEHSE